jgi:hypothetical protein
MVLKLKTRRLILRLSSIIVPGRDHERWNDRLMKGRRCNPGPFCIVGGSMRSFIPYDSISDSWMIDGCWFTNPSFGGIDLMNFNSLNDMKSCVYINVAINWLHSDRSHWLPVLPLLSEVGSLAGQFKQICKF